MSPEASATLSTVAIVGIPTLIGLWLFIRWRTKNVEAKRPRRSNLPKERDKVVHLGSDNGKKPNKRIDL